MTTFALILSVLSNGVVLDFVIDHNLTENDCTTLATEWVATMTSPSATIACYEETTQ